MAAATQAFYALWQEESIQDRLFELLHKEDICNVRLASSACCNLVTKRLFMRTTLTFTANTFTRPCRIQALSRIGHHIEHLSFYMAHSEATFLPPLIHPLTGREICFLYTPHTSMASVLARPKYANTELGEILTQQYPPLFHAATNVPSFINALRHMPNIRHLTVRCPGQDPQERYRRDIVDYALMSLRISLERVPMTKLTKLSLSSLHPSAFLYLRHVPGFGCVPSAGKRWKQIRKLHISVESWDFYGPSPGLDHLKLIEDYIRNFSSTLEKLTFTWLGRKGPCPIALFADPLFAPPRHSKKLFNEVTSPMSPLPAAPLRRPVIFPKLRYMQVRNATMTAPQLSNLVDAHQGTVKEFDFENVVLINGGSWDDALAPLMDNSSNSDAWSRSSTGGSETDSFQTASSEQDLPSPSAAVAAASRDLLDFELGSFGFFDPDDYEDEPLDVDVDDLASDIAAAKAASESFTTKLTKKRLHKRRRRKHRKDDDGEQSERKDRSESRHRGHKSRSRSRHRHHRHRHHRHGGTPEEDDSYRPTTPMPKSTITLPILNTDPQPVLLQPTVYDPNVPKSVHPDDCISSVQRNIEQEEAHRLLAEDAAMRTSALRKAKEAVLMKLSKEFCRKKDASSKESCGAAASMGLRFREGLFGKSMISVHQDHRPMDSQTALVPLMFSRS
jgi:hypothetical protein